MQTNMPVCSVLDQELQLIPHKVFFNYIDPIQDVKVIFLVKFGDSQKVTKEVWKEVKLWTSIKY